MRGGVGRRGAVLLLIGAAWVAQGVALLAGAWAPIALPTLHALAPVEVRAAAWIVPGVVAVAAGLRREHDRWGFVAAVVVPVFMAASWGLALLTGQTGADLARAAVSAYTWGTVAALLIVVSGWPEVPPCEKGRTRG